MHLVNLGDSRAKAPLKVHTMHLSVPIVSDSLDIVDAD